MIAQSLRLANERQERLRDETARNRAKTTGIAGRIAASVASVLRSTLAGPAVATGTILPATH